jgi:ABC-type phosphate/phosphonate transport system ATPase subunit
MDPKSKNAVSLWWIPLDRLDSIFSEHVMRVLFSLANASKVTSLHSLHIC